MKTPIASERCQEVPEKINVAPAVSTRKRNNITDNNEKKKKKETKRCREHRESCHDLRTLFQHHLRRRTPSQAKDGCLYQEILPPPPEMLAIGCYYYHLFLRCFGRFLEEVWSSFGSQWRDPFDNAELEVKIRGPFKDFDLVALGFFFIYFYNFFLKEREREGNTWYLWLDSLVFQPKY